MRMTATIARDRNHNYRKGRARISHAGWGKGGQRLPPDGFPGKLSGRNLCFPGKHGEGLFEFPRENFFRMVVPECRFEDCPLL